MTKTPPQDRPKVTIEIQPLLETHWTGIPVFTRRLIQALVRDGSADLEFMFRLTHVSSDAVFRAIRAGTGIYLRDEIETADPSGVKPADPLSCWLYPSAKHNVAVASREASTIHDVSTLVMPEHHETANIAYHLDHLHTQLSVDSAVFCASDATRSALSAAFPSTSQKSHLLHQYVDWPEHFEAMDRNLPPLALGRYAIVVGTIEPRKNLGILLRSLARRELRSSPLRFLVVGREGWMVDRFLDDLDSDARERVLFTGFVSEFIKYRLIKGSEFLIFPSIYEGFGIPALEAMSLGKPVLASRSSSLPEVVADAGVFFDPLSVEEFASSFAEISSAKRLAELAPRAIERSKFFSWERMAKPVVTWARGDL